MRYMVKGEFNDPGALLPPQQIGELITNVVAPSLEAIGRLESEGKILASGVYAGARCGVFIVEAASNEDVSQLLMGLPFWGFVKWEVTPLESFEARAEQERRIAQRLQEPK